MTKNSSKNNIHQLAAFLYVVEHVFAAQQPVAFAALEALQKD